MAATIDFDCNMRVTRSCAMLIKALQARGHVVAMTGPMLPTQLLWINLVTALFLRLTAAVRRATLKKRCSPTRR